MVPRNGRASRPGPHRTQAREIADFDVLCLQEVAINFAGLPGVAAKIRWPIVCCPARLHRAVLAGNGCG